MKIQFARSHHHIGKHGIEFNRFYIGDIGLSGHMDFHFFGKSIMDNRLIRSDNSSYIIVFCGINNGFHVFQFLIVNDGIQCDIGADIVLFADVSYFF